MQLKSIDEKTYIIENLLEFGSEQEYFHLDFRVTTKCNYNCYYCTDMHNNSNKFTIFNMDNVDDIILNISENVKKPIHVFLYGGEPSIHPDISNILLRIGESLIKHNFCFEKKPILEIQTNLSLDIEKYKSICGKMEEYSGVFKVSASFHNTIAKFPEFIKKCKSISDLGFLGMVTFMYNSKNTSIPKMFNVSKEILGKDHVEISPLISSSVKEKVTEGENSPFFEIDYIFKNEDIQKMSENSYVFKNAINVELSDGSSHKVSRAFMWHNRCNSFLGMTCNVSKERCIIDHDGKVYKCFNNMFDFEKNHVLDIVSDNFSSLEYFKSLENTVCDYKKCFFELEHKKFVKC